jgi:hypothetical protein
MTTTIPAIMPLISPLESGVDTVTFDVGTFDSSQAPLFCVTVVI